MSYNDWVKDYRRKINNAPAPTMPEPTTQEIEDWVLWDSCCEATDGCMVEPDGICPHGHVSWLIHLGII